MRRARRGGGKARRRGRNSQSRNQDRPPELAVITASFGIGLVTSASSLSGERSPMRREVRLNQWIVACLPSGSMSMTRPTEPRRRNSSGGP